MLLHIPAVLDRDTVARCRRLLTEAKWVDGRVTAGLQAEQVKRNLQLPESSPVIGELRGIVVEALARNAMFFAAALPRRLIPPHFNCYTGAANTFGNHVDNAVRGIPGSDEQVRTDVSATLFFCAPDEYDGGELVIEDTFGTQRVKLPAGDLVLYPSSSVHRVEPVTRGMRLASFMWLQSMVRDAERRRMLFDMDLALAALRRGQGDSEPVVRLTTCYHNLLRMWAEV